MVPLRVMKRKSEVSENVYSYYLWDLPEFENAEERLRRVADSCCQMYRFTRYTRCVASFYPYVGLKSTIRIENKTTWIRISDILMDAPEKVLTALIHVLLARTARKKPAEEHLQIYRDYIQQPEIEAKHAETRLKRAKKVLIGSQGKVYDLEDSYNRIQPLYLPEIQVKPTLSWSPRSSKRLLGYHDSHLNLIVISRWLDRKCVPFYVLDYIMYHELLHIVTSCQYRNGKRIVHTKEFKQKERTFAHYEAAIRWLAR